MEEVLSQGCNRTGLHVSSAPTRPTCNFALVLTSTEVGLNRLSAQLCMMSVTTLCRQIFPQISPLPITQNFTKRIDLPGGHIIMLGPGNEAAALDALKAWPGGMHVGGGISGG